jgi:DNA-binding transcriptional LysR family regulator
MELSWLEDFLALIEVGGFSRAAERRHLTQPAFSRRIRALEEWAGGALFDRNSRRVRLTPAGERFRPVAEEVARRLSQAREDLREINDTVGATLRFACTHALSLTFFPDWLRGVERAAPVGSIRLISDSLSACERTMRDGQAQFMLCHYHPAALGRLDARSFVSRMQGDDVLIPVKAPEVPFALAAGGEAPVPYLAYSSESGLGRILAAVRARQEKPPFLSTVFTAHLATALRAMAISGRGVAWLPLTLVETDLGSGRLVRAGGAEWDVAVEVRVYRPRCRLSPAAEAFWTALA